MKTGLDRAVQKAGSCAKAFFKGFVTWHGVAIFSLGISIISASFTYLQNDRTKQLFPVQIAPAIQGIPRMVIADTRINAFQVVMDYRNYSGFEARNVTYDMKYGTNDWIIQWLNADADRLSKKSNRTPDEQRRLAELLKKPWVIPSLKPGQSLSKSTSVSYSLDEICKDNHGIDYRLRLRWENSIGHLFDVIHDYKLVCTKVENGISITFVPKE